MDTIISDLKSSGILHITLNDERKLNVLSDPLLSALQETLLSAKNDSQVKALLLTGAGKAFCAGANINELKSLNSNSGYEFAKRGQAVFNLIEALPKPTLAAINGYAFGGGNELAMATHFRCAASSAKFAQPEIKLGIIPGFGGTQRLSRLIGKTRALDLCLTGRTIDAEQALQWGLVHSVVSDEALLSHSEALLHQILTNAPLAIANILSTINKGYNMPLPEALELEALQFALTCTTQDKQEGIEAFLQKRQPQFSGE